MTLTTKYDVKQKVWRMIDDRPVEDSIDSVTVISSVSLKEQATQYGFRYWCGVWGRWDWYYYDEGKLFATKEELLRSL